MGTFVANLRALTDIKVPVLVIAAKVVKNPFRKGKKSDSIVKESRNRGEIEAGDEKEEVISKINKTEVVMGLKEGTESGKECKRAYRFSLKEPGSWHRSSVGSGKVFPRRRASVSTR